MEKKSSRFLHIVIGGIVAALIVAALFVDNINIVWGVIGLLGLDALYLTISHGWRWWKGTHSKIGLQE